MKTTLSPSWHRAPLRRPSTRPARLQAPLRTGKLRLGLLGFVLISAFLALPFRLIDLAIIQGDTSSNGSWTKVAWTKVAWTKIAPSTWNPGQNQIADFGESRTLTPGSDAIPAAQTARFQEDAQKRRRGDIRDRNGVLLAIDLPVWSIYAEPSAVHEPEETVRALASVFPELGGRDLVTRLVGDSEFVWVRRQVTPEQHAAVLRLGLPGIGFRRENGRIYPHGRTAAHVLGYVDIDRHGIAGVEKTFDDGLRQGAKPLDLSIDVRMQYALCAELARARTEHRAQGAAGVILDVHSAEIMALCSLPDFDPNHPANSEGDQRFNRAVLGVYELGSTFKILTLGMALHYGVIGLDTRFDVTKPLRVASFTIRDYHPENRPLTTAEVLIHSSNIGAALIAHRVGAERQRMFLDQVGLLTPSTVELPEIGRPLLPARWGPTEITTVSYGHGIAVSPLQITASAAAIVNGGIFRQPTLLRREAPAAGVQVISPRISARMRRLMRAVVTSGTGRRADAKGYLVGGKTGSAEKSRNRGYSRTGLISSFLGVFPMDAPRYVMLVMLDEPKGTRATRGYRTGGWVAAPVVRRVIERIAPAGMVEPEVVPGEGENLVQVSDGKDRNRAAR